MFVGRGVLVWCVRCCGLVFAWFFLFVRGIPYLFYWGLVSFVRVRCVFVLHCGYMVRQLEMCFVLYGLCGIVGTFVLGRGGDWMWYWKEGGRELLCSGDCEKW